MSEIQLNTTESIVLWKMLMETSQWDADVPYFDDQPLILMGKTGMSGPLFRLGEEENPYEQGKQRGCEWHTFVLDQRGTVHTRERSVTK